MHMRKFSHVTSYLAVLSVCCVSLLAYYSYKTGCTADLKTGSFGNPQLVLHFSGIAMAWLAVGVLSGTVAVIILPGVKASTRAGLALAFFFLAVVGSGCWAPTLKQSVYSTASRPNNSFKPTPHRGVGHVPALR